MNEKIFTLEQFLKAAVYKATASDDIKSLTENTEEYNELLIKFRGNFYYR